MIASVVLAAGESTRMGAFKPLLPFGPDEKTVLQTVVVGFAASQVGYIVVVVGHRADEVTASLAALNLPPQRVQCVCNADYRSGMLSSVQCGFAVLGERLSGPGGEEIEAAFLALGDMPRVTPAVIDGLIAEQRARGSGLTAPSYGLKAGHPILIHRRYFSDILALRPPQTLRDVTYAHPEDTVLLPVNTSAVVQDLDTPEDYRSAISCTP